jgi:glycosyltransferase involved in cell wall biosynthesis
MDTPLASAAKAFGITKKVVVHLRLPPPENRRMSQIRLGSVSVDRFLVANSNMKEAWLDWGLPESKLRVLPNAFPFEKFPETSYHGPGNGPLRIGYLGRLAEPKGVHVAVEAIAALKNYGIACRLFVGGQPFPEGEWNYQCRLEALAEKLGVKGDVIFLGHVEDLTGFFNKIDLLLFPSLWNEPFGRVIVESILHSRPVVAHSVGSVREILGVDAALWIYDSQDELIKILIDFRKTWEDYPLASIKTSMRSRFSLPDIVNRLVDFLHQD